LYSCNFATFGSGWLKLNPIICTYPLFVPSAANGSSRWFIFSHTKVHSKFNVILRDCVCPCVIACCLVGQDAPRTYMDRGTINRFAIDWPGQWNFFAEHF